MRILSVHKKLSVLVRCPYQRMSVCRGSTVTGPAKLRKYEHENKTRRNWGEEGPEHFNKIQMIYYSPQKAEKTLKFNEENTPL